MSDEAWGAWGTVVGVALALAVLAGLAWYRGGVPGRWTEAEIRAVVRDEMRRAPPP